MASATGPALPVLICCLFCQGFSRSVDSNPGIGVNSNGNKFFMSSHGSQFYSSSSNGGNIFISSNDNLIVTSPGSDITIGCGVFIPSNDRNVHWTKKTSDGREVTLPESYYYNSPMNIRLRNVSESDSGTYTCYAGRDSQEVQKTELKVTRDSQGYHLTPEQMEEWRNFNPLPNNFHQGMSDMSSQLNRDLSEMNSDLHRQTSQMQDQLHQQMSQMNSQLQNMFHY